MSKLLTINQVAEQLSISTKTVYQHVHFKRIPFLKIAGALRFDPIKIQDWLNRSSFEDMPRQPNPTTGKKRGRPRKAGIGNDRIDKIVEQAKKEVGVV